MNAARAWREELRLIAVVVGAMVVLALAFESWLLGLFAALTGYLGIQLANAVQLVRWLSDRKSNYPPEANGLWGEVYRSLAEWERFNRERRHQLADQLVRFQQSTRALPDGLVMLDAEHQILWTNPAARELLGVSGQRDAGSRIENFVRHPEFLRFLHDPSAGACELRSPISATQWLELRRVQFGDSNALLIAHDATERVNVEQMRRDFVADVSHELRTPLTVLSGYLENINRTPELVPDTWQRPVAAMTDQSARMGRIVEDLLLLARMEAGPQGEATTLDVAAIVERVALDTAELSAGREHQIVCDVDSDVQLTGVQQEIHTAFTNLAANAVRYTPDHGCISLRWYAANGACFEVEDSGDGIDEQDVPRLTERFFRVDKGRSRAEGGTGLGLSIVRHILDRHDAQLEIESTLGEGSLFRCRFPHWRAIVAIPEHLADAAAAQEGSSELRPASGE
ncbi:MAG: phosphate regulon sensor histidine kinase PhoR [Pseudomonadota bacterium]